MFLLSADARRAIGAILARDRGAHVTLESAAALHLGRAASVPVSIATELRESSPAVRIVARTSSGRGEVVSCEGLRIASLEATIVELCSRPSAPLAVIAAAELLRAESAIERRAFDGRLLVRLALRHGTGAARRRIAFLLSRSGHDDLASAILPSERTGSVKLDPLGPAGGPADGRFRVIVDVADGFDALDEALAGGMEDLARKELGKVAEEIAALVHLGFPLSASARRRAAIERAAARGFLVAEAEGYRARSPFDRVCGRMAARIGPRRMRGIVDALAGDGELVDAALLDPSRAATLLRDGAIARGVDVARAAAVVQSLGARLAPAVLRPFLERTGRWAEAAELVRGELQKARGAAKIALLLAAAQIAWRRARRRDAGARLDELERAARRGDSRWAIEALLLRATLATESGAHLRARRLLSQAMRVAETAGRDRDRARALHRLGTIEARQGRPVEASAAYRAALDALGAKTAETRALYGILESNLAATAAWLGRWDEAEDLARAALEDKRIAGTFSEVVTTKVLLARIARGRGLPVPAGGRVPPLIDDVERTGDPRLRVEAFLDLAEELAREGDPIGAERAIDHARTALYTLDRSEPILDALLAHVDGLVAGLAGDRDEALVRIDRAARGLDKLHGAFWAARARRDAASIADSAGRADEALSRLALVERACREHRFVLGEDATHVALHALAALEGTGAVRRFGERAIASIGPSVARSKLLALGERTRADALRTRALGNAASAVAVVHAPDGERAIDARERARLLRGVPDSIVLDERGPALVLPDGTRVELVRRRLLAPLLRTLAAHDGEPVPLDTLARTVWERRDASARAAVKMSISRLRSLLGALGDDLVAVRVGGALSYGFRRPIPLLRLTSA